jgi:competence protein ComEC
MVVHDDSLNNDDVTIHVLAVGQADATAITTQNGRIFLLDADKKNVKKQLDTAIVERTPAKTEEGRIPLIFGTTHIDEDHVDGIDSLYPRYEIQSAIQPDARRFEISDAETGKPKGGVGQKIIESYINGLEEHGLGTNDIRQVSEGDEISIDSNTDIKVLAPPDDAEKVNVTRASTGADVNLPSERSNENGAVYKLEGERSALFMGDVQDKSDHYAESWLIQRHDAGNIDLSADMLFIGHHGSGNATSPEFLARVDPEIAVISSDLGKEHDHPHDSVLKTLHEHDVDVYWTAGHGTIRTDLDAALHTASTNDLETTNAADLAALKHYCRENDVAPEEVETLAPGHLPKETPEWITTGAPLVAQTREEIANAAITNAETTEDVYQGLKDHHPANRHLYLAIEDDRTEHVTTAATVRENQQRRDTAERRRAAAQPSWRDRLQRTLPLVPNPDLPEYNGPAPEEIAGPFEEAELAETVRDSRTAKTMRDDPFTDESPPDYLLDAEEHANTAVNNADNVVDLCETLRDHPGTHRDLMKAIETHDTHLPENLVSNDKTTTQEISQDLSHDEGRGLSL